MYRSALGSGEPAGARWALTMLRRHSYIETAAFSVSNPYSLPTSRVRIRAKRVPGPVPELLGVVRASPRRSGTKREPSRDNR